MAKVEIQPHAVLLDSQSSSSNVMNIQFFMITAYRVLIPFEG